MIYILSGDTGIGKSYSLLQWVRHRTDVFGILSPRMVDVDRCFFDIKNKKVFSMQASKVGVDSISVGRYHFLKSAFKRANNIINRSLKQIESGYLIIDEFGKLELQSKGLHQSASLAIDKTLSSSKLHLILVVRTSLLKDIIDKYNIMDYQLINMHELSDKLM